MRKTLAVAGKELRQIARDPLTLALLVGVPAFMLVVFGYAVNFDVENLALAVEDRDLSAASRELVRTFTASRRFAVTAVLMDREDPEASIEAGRARAALVIPERFSERLTAGRPAEVQLLVDGSDSTTASTALGYASGVVTSFNEGLVRNQLARAGAAPGAAIRAVRVEPRVWYNPELRSAHFLVPGLIGFVLMITAVLSTALSVVREKETGTMEQLGVAPVNPLQVLLGKTVPYLGLSLVAMALILLAARVFFGVVVQGSYLDVFALTGLYLLGGLAWGLLVSTVVESQASAFQLGVFSSMLPAILLSGFVFPIRNMPVALQVLSHLVPARYYLVALRGVILKGAGLTVYWDQVAALAVYTAVVLAAAGLRYRRGEV
jgi:ABC-2 type transport system permease protein